MRVIKTAICILVIFALAISVVPTPVSASALSVVGTSFSSAGLTSAEFVASAGPYAIGILAALAAAYGIKTFTESDTGQAVKQYFTDLIRERAVETRRSEAEVMEALLSNATIGEQGNIVLGRLSYAEAKEILLRDYIQPERPSMNITLKTFAFGNSRDYIYHSDSNSTQYKYYKGVNASYVNNMFFQSRLANATRLYFVTIQGITTDATSYVTEENLNTGAIVQNPVSTTQYIFNIGDRQCVINRISTRQGYYNNSAPTYDINDIINQQYTADDLIINYPTDTLYGVDETLRGQNVGLHEGLVLAPDLINSAVIGGASGEISASDYCGALVDYVSGYDTVVDGVTVTGLPEAATVPRSIDEAPTADTVIDEAPPSTMTGTEAAGLYSFSLDELFPFCLPFDFVKIIEKFNVEPEAPNFDWRFYIPGVIDYTLHIDLSAWNTAAEVCRTMVLIAFMVGLIMLTRQIFIRA